MSDKQFPSSSNKVVDFKSRAGERQAHSQFGHFVPDEELLQSTARIKSKRDELKERLNKMTDSQTRVSKSVFEKVRRDYLLQLETVESLLLEKKQSLKDEIKKLFVSREKLSFEVNRHKEILEEAEFRHYLGDFSESNFKEVEEFETREIEKIENDLSHIQQWIKIHEELFDPEDFGLPKPKATDVTKTAHVFEVTKTVEPVVVPAPLPNSNKAESVPSPQPTPVVTAQTTQAPVAQEPAAIPNPEPALPKPTADVANPDALPSADDFAHLFKETAETSAEEIYGHTEHNIKSILQDSGEETTPSIDESKEAVIQAAAQTTETQDAVAETPNDNPSDENDFIPQEPSIDDLLEETFELGDDDVVFPEPEPEPDSETETEAESESNDYFQKSEIGEKTYNSQTDVKKIESSLTQTELTSNANIKPIDSKPVKTDDSISVILNSIKLEDEFDVPASTPNPAPHSSLAGARLILTSGDLDQSEFALKDNTAIGRSPSGDVVLKEPKVSRQHAAINKYNNDYILIDLKSSNGVFVNGTKIDEATLHAGDEISIGSYKFIFQV